MKNKFSKLAEEFIKLHETPNTELSSSLQDFIYRFANYLDSLEEKPEPAKKIEKIELEWVIKEFKQQQTNTYLVDKINEIVDHLNNLK